jgi:two-component system cell cycle response regulator DivK
MAKAHALIVDDNSENLEVLGRLLAVNNVTCTAVQDTGRIEQTLQEITEVNVVFLDLEMPKHNGYEILGLVRNTFGDTLPIIACAVHSNEMVAARENGFDGFIVKPLDPQLFSTQLSQILNGEFVWDGS